MAAGRHRSGQRRIIGRADPDTPASFDTTPEPDTPIEVGDSDGLVLKALGQEPSLDLSRVIERLGFGALWHGPLGAGERFATRADKIARASERGWATHVINATERVKAIEIGDRLGLHEIQLAVEDCPSSELSR